MNITYIVIFAIVSAIAIYTILHASDWHESYTPWRYMTGFGSFIAFCMMLGFSFAYLGEKTTVISKANYQRIGDQIVVQVDGWPVQLTSDIRYLDKPLSIIKTIKRNAWGVEAATEYTISETILPEAH